MLSIRPKTFAIIAGCSVAALCCNPIPLILLEMGRITAEQCQIISYNQGRFASLILIGSVVIWLIIWSHSKKRSAEGTNEKRSPNTLFRRSTVVLLVTCLVLCALLPIVILLLDRRDERHNAWITFVSEECSFTARFPKQPDASDEIRQYAPGVAVPRYMFTCSTEDHRGSHWIEVQEFPDAVTQGWTDAPDLLLKMQEATIVEADGHLHSERAVQLDEHIGREWVYECTQGPKRSFVLQRTYIVGSRLYLINVTKTTSLEDVQTVGARFADSFELLAPR